MEEQRQVYMKYDKEEEVKERPGGGRRATRYRAFFIKPVIKAVWYWSKNAPIDQ